LVRVNNKLRCPECGRIELRKISSEYGKGII
ncbi:MAG: RNA-binding protein, partial [Candidatus Hydrothermarchaeota archaeon]